MKVASLATHIVATPPPHIGGMYWIFVRLATADGIEGVGECYCTGFGPRAVTALIEDVFSRHLEGQDPRDVERFFRRAYSSGFTQRPDPTMMGVVSGLEMACWDIAGKAAGLPVYKLLGGRVHERLRSYSYLYPERADGTIDYDDPDLAGEAAAQMVERGFTAIKFDPVGPYTAFDGRQLSPEAMAHAVRYTAAVREAVGERADILFGTHGQMTPAGAIRLARRLEPFDPLWFEEPVPPGQEEEMAQVARATSIPVATGERLCTKYEFARVMRSGAAAIVQMNAGRVGGLMEAKKIAGMAEAFGIQIAPHLYNGPVGAAASIQLAAASPNLLIHEAIGEFGGFHAKILTTKIAAEGGWLIPSDAPGLGVELDLDAVTRAEGYDGDQLHLEMAPDPA